MARERDQSRGERSSAVVDRDRRRERSPIRPSRRERERSPVRKERSRSRSPIDGSRRHRERERHYDERDRSDRDRRRSRSRSPRDRRDSRDEAGSSKSKQRNDRDKKDIKKEPEPPKVDIESLVAVEDDMMAMMGFGGFDTTKNKKVEGNVTGVAKVNKPRKYRQYMNRKGGFNRPLDYIS